MTKHLPIHYTGITNNDELAFSLAAHSSLGRTALSLILLRILWRLGNPAPPLPDSVAPLQATASKILHLMLYTLMIYVPLTGIYTAAAHEITVTPYGAFELRQTLSFLGAGDFDGRRFLHEIGTWLLITTLVVHILAAFLHQFIQKDGILRRIWFGREKQLR